MTAASDTTFSHLHTCQTPTEAYCRERATDMVETAETGAILELCEAHALEALRDEWGSLYAPIPSTDPEWLAPMC